MTNGRLKNNIAVITGAGRGIGEAIASAMAQEGAKVVAIEVSEKRCQEIVQKVRGESGEIMSVCADVSNRSDIEKAVEAVSHRYEKIDILVNNAAIMMVENFMDGEIKRWEQIISVNLTGLILFSQAVLKDMMKRRSGKIINIASLAGLVPCARQVVYSAAKGGVVSFTRSLAAEMAPYHINVNAICPGSVETPKYLEALNVLPEHLKPYQQRMQRDIPWGRVARPAEIADLAVFLASENSRYITGQCIAVDGGGSHFPNVSMSYPYIL